jgi:hypothetical protein
MNPNLSPISRIRDSGSEQILLICHDLLQWKIYSDE